MEGDRQFQKEFKVKSTIGSGTFGVVRKCIQTRTDQLCAVKTIQNVNGMNIQKIEQEVEIMKKAASDYCLALNDHFRDHSSYHIVMPYCRQGSLQKKIMDNWSLDSLLMFLAQISQGFIDLLEKQTMHLDLKPENILLKNSEQYLICDFGCSRVHQTIQQSAHFLKLSFSKGVGTAQYAAPEMAKDTKANKYSDVWSLGVILYKMIYHKTPFPKANQNLNFGSYKTSYEGHSPQLQPIVDLLKKMLSLENRPKWTYVKASVYQMLKLQEHQVIVTSVSDYVELIKNISILSTCLVQLLSRISKILGPKKIEYDFASTLLLYAQNFAEVIFNTDEYYFFQSTKNRMSAEDLARISTLRKQLNKIVITTNLKSFKNKNLYTQKQQIFTKAEEFQTNLNKDQELKTKLQTQSQLEFFKIVKIIDFLQSCKDPLNYKNKKQLKKLVNFLVHS